MLRPKAAVRKANIAVPMEYGDGLTDTGKTSDAASSWGAAAARRALRVFTTGAFGLPLLHTVGDSSFFSPLDTLQGQSPERAVQACTHADARARARMQRGVSPPPAVVGRNHP